MRELNRYDALKKAHEEVLADQARAAAPQPYRPITYDLDLIEARLAAHEQSLAAKVAAGRIDDREKVYEQRRFDNEQLVAMEAAAAREDKPPAPTVLPPPGQGPPGPGGQRERGWTDQGDMVSQQASAHAWAKAAQERTRGPERGEPEKVPAERQKIDWQRYLGDREYRWQVATEQRQRRDERARQQELSMSGDTPARPRNEGRQRADDYDLTR